jgi:hypothetical protein
MLQIGPITPKQTSNDARTTHDLQIHVAAPEALPSDFWNPFTRRALLQASRIFNGSVSNLPDPACHHPLPPGGLREKDSDCSSSRNNRIVHVDRRNICDTKSGSRQQAPRIPTE